MPSATRRWRYHACKSPATGSQGEVKLYKLMAHLQAAQMMARIEEGLILRFNCAPANWAGCCHDSCSAAADHLHVVLAIIPRLGDSTYTGVSGPRTRLFEVAQVLWPVPWIALLALASSISKVCGPKYLQAHGIYVVQAGASDQYNCRPPVRVTSMNFLEQAYGPSRVAMRALRQLCESACTIAMQLPLADTQQVMHSLRHCLHADQGKCQPDTTRRCPAT